MSLLPDVERELMRVARARETSGDLPRRTGLGPWVRRSLPAATLALVVIAALAIGGVFLAGLRSGHGGGAGRPPTTGTVNSLFPGAPTTQGGGWMGGSNLCPPAAANRYLPRRSGCVSVAPAGQRDLALVYAHLSHRKVGREYVPSFFILEVLRYHRPALRVRLHPAEGNPAILLVGRSTALQGAKIFIETGHISSGSSAVVYSLWHGRLAPAGVTLAFGRDSAQAATFQCRAGPPAAVVQRSWVLERGGENGWWRRTLTTFAWRGPRLVRTSRASSLRRGPVALSAPGQGCKKPTRSRG